MIYPTIDELTKNKFNRYELAIATAKCARNITTERSKQLDAADRCLNKDSEKPTSNTIDKDCKEEKPVKNAINKIYNGSYVIVRVSKSDDGEKKFI